MSKGYLLINKPPGPTSHDVIDKLRGITGERRIGHAGTIDPFARGLLLVGVGREATRNLGKFVGLDKRYRAILKLGAVSNTYDRTGEITDYGVPITNYESRIHSVLNSFIGKEKQIPPQYSAKKVKGKKAYEFARAGEEVFLKPQEIEIYDIKLLATGHELFALEIHCSSGTYIRSLAHDIGQKLGCGAYIEELTRVAIGNFTLEESTALQDISPENWQSHLITFRTVMATGTFEILHKGHEHYLREAKKLGERLLVVVARQNRAEELRGRKLRKTAEERRTRVASFKFVDEAILGDERDPYESVKKIAPDIIALGYDQELFVRELPVKIKEFGLSTKIARIPPYMAEQYKSSLIVSDSPYRALLTNPKAL